MTNEKGGIVLNFNEQPGSLSSVLMVYIKENPGDKGSILKQRKLIDHIVKLAGVDLKKWAVKEFRLIPNSWAVTMKQKKYDAESESLGETKNGSPMKNFSASSESWGEQAYNFQLKVEIKFERIIPKQEDALKALKYQLPKFKFSHYIPRYDGQRGEVCLETAVLDAHVGKLAWMYETNYRNYDTNIALEDYRYALDQHLAWGSMFRPDVIEYVLGQDMFHVDNMTGHTTNGSHNMDVDGRLTKITQKAAEIVIRNIYECRKMSPVNVRWIPGNHDFYASFSLAYIIKEHFRKDRFVFVDLGNSSRKAVLWGNLLVGYTHRIVGKHNSWGNELAQMFPDLWGKSKFREWHHGDQHKKQDVKLVPTFTNGGVLCRQLTALSPVDKWHFENVFTDAVPGGEAFLWSKDQGVFANFIAWTGQYENNRNEIINKKHHESGVFTV